jgi:hypothetical protein
MLPAPLSPEVTIDGNRVPHYSVSNAILLERGQSWYWLEFVVSNYHPPDLFLDRSDTEGIIDG